MAELDLCHGRWSCMIQPDKHCLTESFTLSLGHWTYKFKLVLEAMFVILQYITITNHHLLWPFQPTVLSETYILYVSGVIMLVSCSSCCLLLQLPAYVDYLHLTTKEFHEREIICVFLRPFLKLKYGSMENQLPILTFLYF